MSDSVPEPPTSSPLCCILSAPGSRGDVNPMVAIGAELRRRGHHVVISLAEPYVEVAESFGLLAESVVDRVRFDALLSDPAVWEPFRGARKIFRHAAEDFLPAHLDVIDRHHVAGRTVLVSHPLDFASRIVRELHEDTPLVDVHLAPSMLRTFDDPPRMTPYRFELSRPPWLVAAAYHILDHCLADPVMKRTINRHRSARGLSPVSRILADWWLSPDRILGLYPDWFAPATKAFRPRLLHCGFPLSDDYQAKHGDTNTGKSAIGECSGSPVVFTTGTAHQHAKAFFASAADACQSLGCEGLFATSHPDNLPNRLSPRIQAVDYFPFSRLLPRCRAIVHHGGIGTTSTAIAAGIPQLIRPLAFDQFDNARHVERLGVGLQLQHDHDLTDRLARLLDDPGFRDAAKRVGETADGSASIARAVDAIERSSAATVVWGEDADAVDGQSDSMTI